MRIGEKKGYLFSTAPFRQQKLSSHLEKYLLLWKLGHVKFDERNANFLVNRRWLRETVL